MIPSAQVLYQVIDATWPAQTIFEQNGWTFRLGSGGGQRVSAATRSHSDAEIGYAISKMKSLDQTPLFMIQENQEDLDQELSDRGFKIKDPVVLMVANCASVAAKHDHATFSSTPSTQAAEIWESGGIGPARLAIMKRCSEPKAIVEIQSEQSTVATGFTAIHQNIAMTHAVEVEKNHRRQGHAQTLMQSSAYWAHKQNAIWLAVLTVKENLPARALYAGLGFKEVCEYHYRVKP